MTRRLAIAALVLGISLTAAPSAMACSCARVRDRDKLKAADGAFVGRLVAIREVDPPAEGEPIGSGDPMDYIYRVGRVYKRGPGLRRGRRVAVRSVRSEVTCGVPNSRGELYGLFVNRENHRWHGNLCLTTTPRKLRRAAEAASSAGSGPGSAGCA
jgi:hypothetical protein